MATEPQMREPGRGTGRGVRATGPGRKSRRIVVRAVRSAAASALILCLLAGPGAARELFVLRWSQPSQLTALDTDRLVTRYIAPGIAVVEADSAALPHIAGLGFDIAASGTAGAGEAWYLSDHLHYPLPPGQELLYLDRRGWGLSKIGEADFGRVHDEQIFLYPLPDRFAVDGWVPAPRPKRTAPAAAAGVEEVIAGVDVERLRDDIERLSLIDPSRGSVEGNLHTRFARRPETFESTRYIREQLAAVLGDDAVRLQEFTISEGDSVMYNVIGDLSGADPEAGYYIVCAHYDAIGTRSRDWDWRTDPAPGADDNATGVALVIESARVLADRQFPWSIRFIAWSGEELGLWGSRHYAAEALAGDERILGVLNFDMIGFNDLHDRIELVSNPESLWLVDLMRSANERYGIGLRVDLLEDRYAGLSDHAPFWARGYDAILGIENYLPTDSTTAGVRDGLYRLNTQYHTVRDVPDSVNWELVAGVTRLTVATLAQFGTGDSLPNLMVAGGDLKGDAEDNLRVRVANVGTAPLEGAFHLRVSRCAADSTGCRVVFDQRRPGPLAAGAVDDVAFPWHRFGEMVFLVEVEPEGEIEEASESDNRAFQNVRLIPADRIVVYPNPFAPQQDQYLAFSGVPLFSRVQIASLDGELLWTGREEAQNDLSNEIRWRGVNEAGFIVGSGVYIYSIRDGDGELLRRDKIAVLR